MLTVPGKSISTQILSSRAGIGAAFEIPGPGHPAARYARDYKKAVAARLAETAREAGATNPGQLGEQLALLIDGASARFDGEVPRTLDELVTLPGVGRKTANVILGNAFDIPGITVDTHFGRLVRRWRWTELEDPVKVEFAIGELIPRKEWTLLSHRVIFHGRRVCHAKKPACGVCVLAKDCPSFGLGPDRPADRRRVGEGSRDRASAGAGRPLSAPGTVRASTRWTLAALVVIVALAVALWREVGAQDAGTDGGRGGDAGHQCRPRAPRRRHPAGIGRPTGEG